MWQSQLNRYMTLRVHKHKSADVQLIDVPEEFIPQTQGENRHLELFHICKPFIFLKF